MEEIKMMEYCNTCKIVNNGGLRFYQGRQPLAHLVWNENNPDNLRQPGMIIHH